MVLYVIIIVLFSHLTHANSQTGVIAFSNTPPDDNNEIYTVNTDGTNPTKLTNRFGRDAGPNWSPDARKIVFYTHFDNQNIWSIFVMDANGRNIQRLTNTVNVYDSSPIWSPDGTQIMFTREYPLQDFKAELWTMDADGSNLKRFYDIDGLGGCWSPDGSKVAFCSSQNGNFEIYNINVDGSDLIRLTNNSARDLWPSWSPNGERLVFISERDGNSEIYTMKTDGTDIKRLTNNPGIDIDPDWSPDGMQIAFNSNRGGSYEIYIMNSDGSNQTKITSMPVHNIQPDWRPIAASGIEVKKNINSIENLQIFQNYPNPFNPITTIKFQLLEPTEISLIIYDIQGRIIKSIIEKTQFGSGTYEYNWNGNNAQSGVYFYILQSGSFKQMKKMVLVK